MTTGRINQIAIVSKEKREKLESKVKTQETDLKVRTFAFQLNSFPFTSSTTEAIKEMGSNLMLF